MSISTLCNEIAEKIVAVKQKGFADGEKAEHDAFWDAFQAYGRRTSYLMAFANTSWNDGDFYPKYDIKPTQNCSQMFCYNTVTNIKQRLEDCGVVLDMSNVTNLTEAFAAAQTSTVPPLDLKKTTTMTRCFQDAKKLTQAPLKNVSGVTKWTNTFNGCTLLTDIGQESGDFGYFSTSVNLSQTAIRFDNDKMCLHALKDCMIAGGDPSQSMSYLAIRPTTKQTLTINSHQRNQIEEYMMQRTDGAFGYNVFQEVCTWINWSVVDV